VSHKRTNMDFLIDGPAEAPHTFVFAHGAGGPMDTPFMTAIARGLAARGIRVVRFEFPYMAARRIGKRNSAPDREPVLLQAWRDAVGAQPSGTRIAIGGKSLGGRMASMVADELGVDGLVCFGYPFHPASQPQRLRTAHLQSLRTPALIIQGERDPFGNATEVVRYQLAKTIRLAWMPDGDHSFKPRVKSGATEAGNLGQTVELAAAFIRGLAPGRKA
jgi:predicted alpha/beta-hydrolase family hydrolase